MEFYKTIKREHFVCETWRLSGLSEACTARLLQRIEGISGKQYIRKMGKKRRGDLKINLILGKRDAYID